MPPTQDVHLPGARPGQGATQPGGVARENARNKSHSTHPHGRALLTAGAHLPTWGGQVSDLPAAKSALVDP